MRLAVMVGAALLAAMPAAAEVPVVVTDIPPVQALVAAVMGDLGAPQMLLERGGDEHDMALRPSQMRLIAEAGLVVWVGPDLTPGLAEAIGAGGGAKLALLDDPATQRMTYADGGVNPHAWLDPGNAKVWADLIAGQLAALDPDNAATYRANAAKAAADIDALDAALAAELAPAQGKPFLTYHDAYGYFAQHYHLTYLGGLASGDAAAPGAARLSSMAALSATGAIACAFPEAQHDPALLQALGNLPLGGALDPVGSTLDPGPHAYDQLMQAMADTLTACLTR